MNPVRVFISYSHQDDALRKKLHTHLSQLKRDGLVEAWDDREIPAGAEWADEIDTRLESANIILLLVSADFIASDFCCGKEMKRAIERHKVSSDRAIVIPVILRKCDWKTAPFAKLQALPQNCLPVFDPVWRTEDDYFEAVASGLRRRINELISAQEGVPLGTEVRIDDPQVPPVRRFMWSFLCIALCAIATVCWWMQMSSAVDREIKVGLMAMRQGRYSDARDRLEKVAHRWIVGLRATPALEKARLGVSLEPEGREILVEPFADGVEKLSRENPRDPDVLFFEGALAMENGNWDEAASKFKEALELEPNFPEAHYHLGSYFLKMGRYSDALAPLNTAGKYAPNAPHYRNARAFAKRMIGDLEGAEDDYRHSANGGSILSRLELAELLWCAGKFQEAEAEQEAAIKELQGSSGGLKGRNSLPWSFNTKTDESVTLNALDEKICFARLSLFASQSVLEKTPGQPDLRDCGPNKIAITEAVAWSLKHAAGKLPSPLSGRARQVVDALLAHSRTGEGTQ